MHQCKHGRRFSKESTYFSAVSRDSARLAFLLAAVKGLNILTADVRATYYQGLIGVLRWIWDGLTI
jgi:hypothetical protein